MSSENDETPYRSGNAATLLRLAELEREVARLRQSAARTEPPALVALRLTHLREDRALVVAGYRAARRVLFPATATAMLGTFAFYLYTATQYPAAALWLWLSCAIAETVLATGGLGLGALLHHRARARCRAIDRRIAEERTLASLDDRAPADSDPLALPEADPLAELEEPRARVVVR